MVVASAGIMDVKPRIISAEVKRVDHSSITADVHNSKPHIAGELDLVGETTSEPHWVEVRDGHLVVYPRSVNATSSPVWRLPLTRLNLQPAASGRPRGFSLSRHGESAPLATFQVNNELEYERWVKTLAAELMRQTPLEAVRFLDILGITATIPPRVSPSRELLVDEHFVSGDVEPGRWTSLFRPNTDCHKQVNNNNNNNYNNSNTLNRKVNVCLNRGCDKVDSGAVIQRSLSETFAKCKVPKVSTVHFKEPTVIASATSVKEPTIIKEKENVSRIRFVESNVIPVNCKKPDAISFRYKESNSNYIPVKGVTVTTGYGNCEQKLPTKVTSVVDFKSATVVDKVTTRDINQNVFSNQCKESDLVRDRSNKVKTLLKTFLSEDVKSTKDFSRRTVRHESATLGRPPLPDVVKDLPPCERRSRARTRLQEALHFRGQSAEPWHTSQCQGSESESGDEVAVNELMARCQQGDKYVSVRDKRLLFESLCRRTDRRIVCSSDNISEIAAVSDHSSIPKRPPRTQSLHDLTRYNSVAVKEICRYFEQRGGSRGETTTRSPSPECRLRLEDRRKDVVTAVEFHDRRQFNRAQRRLARIRQNITDSEETVWRLQEQSSKLAQGRRNEATRLQASIELRLQEERERLKKFQDEALKMQRDIDIAADKFVVVPAKVRHHSDIR